MKNFRAYFFLFLLVASFGLVNAEVIERGSYWNRIDNGDGTYSLEVSSGIINSFNGTGYVEENITFENSSDPLFDYMVNTSYYVSYFNIDPTDGNGAIKLDRNSTFFRFQPMALNYIDEFDAIDPISQIQAISGVQNGNDFVYSEAYGPGINLTYSVNPTFIKENLVIQNLSSLGTMGTLPGSTYWVEINFNMVTSASQLIVEGVDLLSGNNEITTSEEAVVKDSDGNTIYVFQKPYAYDSNGSSININYTFKKQGPSLYVRLKTPYDWLNSSQREFPVYIDPSLSIGITPQGEGDSYVSDAGPNSGTNFGTEALLKTDNDKRAYIKFNVSAIPDAQNIDDALACMFVTTKKDQTVDVSHVYDWAWNEYTVTWDNQPCGDAFDNSTACNLTSESSIFVDSSDQYSWKCWSVKNSLQQAYESEDILSLAFQTADNTLVAFNSRESANPSLYPYLDILYSVANVGPSLSLYSPEEKSYGYNTTLSLNYTASDVDGNLDSCWYNVDGGVNVSLTGCLNTTFSVGEGGHQLYLYANDTLGFETMVERNFSVVNAGPNLSIYSPQDIAYYFNTTISLNYTVSDVDGNLDSCWYNIDDGINVSLTGCLNTTFNLNDGNYSLNLYANDTLGYEVKEVVNFSVVNFAPALEIYSPEEITYDYNTSIPLNYIVSDSDGNLDSCWYNLDNGANVSLLGCLNTTFDLSNGNYVLNIFANDTLGYEVFDSRIFSVDTFGVSVEIFEPTGTKDSRTGILIDYNYTGENVICWYNVKTSIGGDVILNTTLANCSNSFFDVSIDGDYILNLFVNNSFGSINSSNSSFTVATPGTGGGGGSGGGGSSGGGSSGGGGGSTGGFGPPFYIDAVRAIVLIGEEKNLQISVKNKGFVSANKCSVSAGEGYEEYVEAGQIENIAGGEIFEFDFILKAIDVNVENVVISIDCLENITQIVPLDVAVLFPEIDVSFDSISFTENEELKIDYSVGSTFNQKKDFTFRLFSSSGEIINEVLVELDLEEGVVYNGEAVVSLNDAKNGMIKVAIADENGEAFVEENVIYGGAGTATGFALLDIDGTTSSIWAIVLFFLVVGFFVVRRIWKLRNGASSVKNSGSKKVTKKVKRTREEIKESKAVKKFWKKMDKKAIKHSKKMKKKKTARKKR